MIFSRPGLLITLLLLLAVIDTDPLPCPRAALFPPIRDNLGLERAGARRTRRWGSAVHLPRGFEAGHGFIAVHLRGSGASSSQRGFFTRAVHEGAGGTPSGRIPQIVATRLQ